MIAKKVTSWVHQVMKPYVERGNILVDGTAGNGFDTLFLAQHSKSDAKVFAIDIQQVALDQTQQLLLDHELLEKTNLIHGNHANLEQYLSRPMDVGILNLGYLPQGDKEVTTITENTILTLEKWLKMLSVHGAISITCYPGHPEGLREYEKVSQFLADLPGKYFQVLKMEGWNRLSMVPIPFFIERIKEDTT